VLLVGTTDNAIGSAGNDQFIMDIPSDGNSAAAIEDFDPNEDVLSILHDEQKDGALHITVTDSGHDDALVTVDGQTLVIIKGGAGSFTTANIQVEAGVQVAAQ
jgi:Ca2+-binding RTX toxin-like protein